MSVLFSSSEHFLFPILAVALGLVMLNNTVVTPIAGQREARRQAEWDSLLSGNHLVIEPTSGYSRADIVLFTDYECRFCRIAEKEVMPALMAAGVRVHLRHYPLPIHRSARSAALVSACSSLAGEGLATHQALMDGSTGDLGLRIGKLLRADPRLRACAASEWASNALAWDLALAVRVGARGTPMWVTPHRRVFGVPRIGAVEEWIRSLGVPVPSDLPGRKSTDG